MDILLLNPSLDYQKDGKFLKSLRVNPKLGWNETPRIGIAYMLSVAKKQGLTSSYIDMVAGSVSVDDLFKFIEKNKPKTIGMTAFTTQIEVAGRIAGLIKKKYPDITTVIGGSHATACPDLTRIQFPSFDIVHVGEGERFINGQRYENLDDLPFPDWGVFNLELYSGTIPHNTKRELPISTSRGCPFSCVFCCRQFGKKRRHRSINSIIEELWYDVNNFDCTAVNFCDETFVVDKKWSMALFQRMIDEELHKKIRWGCETRVDTSSKELFKLMKEAGCYYVFFGLESGNNQILKNCKKNFTTDMIRTAVSHAIKEDLICAGSFILGLPSETKETALESIQLGKELGIWSVTFPIAVPFPGTELREMALKGEYGLRILSNRWGDYGKQHPGVMESDKLSIDELRQLQKMAYNEIPKMIEIKNRIS